MKKEGVSLRRNTWNLGNLPLSLKKVHTFWSSMSRTKSELWYQLWDTMHNKKNVHYSRFFCNFCLAFDLFLQIPFFLDGNHHVKPLGQLVKATQLISGCSDATPHLMEALRARTSLIHFAKDSVKSKRWDWEKSRLLQLESGQMNVLSIIRSLENMI